MADKIVVLHDGYVEQSGAPLELYDRPANVFVAGFIGSPSMNFLEGRIVEGRFRAASGLELPLPPDTAATPGQEVIYGIRPEHIAPDPAGIVGRVALLEETGSEIFARLDVQGHDILCLFRERLDMRFGDSFGIRIDPQKAHLFDKATGQRIS